MGKIGRNIVMGLDQKAFEAVEKIDSFRNNRKLFGISKQRAGRRKMLLGLVVLKIKVGCLKLVWMIEKKSGRSIWKS